MKLIFIHEKISIGNKEVIHFVGIGGIGMSGLAHIMKMMDFTFKEVIYILIKTSKIVRKLEYLYLL